MHFFALHKSRIFLFSFTVALAISFIFASNAAWTMIVPEEDSGELCNCPLANNNAPIFSGLEERLDQQNLKFELKRIERTFDSIDDLFKHAVIKVQTFDKNNKLSAETITVLSDFLSRPHKLSEITAAIHKSIHRDLDRDELDIVQHLEKPSLPIAVRALWHNKKISDQKAQQIILNNAPMSSQDLIRLIENGAARTHKGYYVQLRTGHNYGDTLKLFETITRVLKEIRESTDSDLADLPTSRLLTPPFHPAISTAFTNRNLVVRDIISDANVIREMRRLFLFVSSIGMPIRFRAGAVRIGPGDVGEPSHVNTVNSTNLIVTPRTLSAVLVGNHYFSGNNSSLTNSLFINPLAITYGGGYHWDNHGSDWWLSYSSGFLGGGVNFTSNFDKGTSWSNGQPTYITFGAIAGGWRDNVMAGFNMATMLANSIGIGASAHMSITRSHDVTYLGQYPLDGMIASIRGAHKIQIDDLIGVGVEGAGAINFSAAEVPITVAFKAAALHTRARVYRTHTDLIKAQDMMSEAGVPGILYLIGKKIKETRMPKFEEPEELIEGDEFVETKIGKLTGGLVLSLETMVPIHAARVGGGIDMTAEFELGLQRLPNDKYQVSIKPERILEMGIFGSMLNVVGAGYVKSMAIARKQIFIFDFTNPKARIGYFDLIHHGRLPISKDIEIYSEDRGPEYLLTEFRAQNEDLVPRGISRTYLEKVKIFTSKTHAGFSMPLIDLACDIINKVDEKTRKTKQRLDLTFEGVDREFVRSHAKSVATNGILSVRKSVFGGRRSEGQGFSGRYNQDIFVTHRRTHTIDNSHSEFAGNKWQFDGLLVHFQLEDTKITGNEENKMAEQINRLFSAFIGNFQYKNSKSLRIINIEREFTTRDLAHLTTQACRDRLSIASQTSGVNQLEISSLLKSLEGKHPDNQGLLVKDFIETQPGAAGFAALHQLLGAQPEDLIIRTESGYSQAVLEAKTFIAMNSKSENADTHDKGPVVNLEPFTSAKNRKRTREFYDDARTHIRELDNQLRLLHDDKYLIDDESPLIKIYGAAKVKELIEKGVRQDKTPIRSALVSARRTILEILDLKAHNFSDEEREIIYKMAGKDCLRIAEIVELMLKKYEPLPLAPSMKKDYLQKRLQKTWEMIAKIDERILRVENDSVMKTMDPDYVNRYHRELVEMRQRLADTAATDHLDEYQLELITKTLTTKKHRIRRTNSVIAIDGALATFYQSGSSGPSALNNETLGRVPHCVDNEEAGTAKTKKGPHQSF